MEAYAEELLHDLGIMREIDQAVPEWVQPYVTVDLRMLGQDLAQDCYVVEEDDGVWVYEVG